MKPIQIWADPFEVRGNIKVVDPVRVSNPDLDEEMEMKQMNIMHCLFLDGIIKMLIKPVMIIYRF